MTNGVRWGPVAGQLRLLAADQVGMRWVVRSGCTGKRGPCLQCRRLAVIPVEGCLEAAEYAILQPPVSCRPPAHCCFVCRRFLRLQSCYVYIFDLPDPFPPDNVASSSSGSGGSASGDLRPEQMLCSGLGEASPHWRMRPVNFFRAQQHLMGARVSQQFPSADAAGQPPAEAPPNAAPARSQRAAAAAASAAWAPLARAAAGRSIARGSPYMTAALGPFPVPCNLAAASPDGRWVAGERGGGRPRIPNAPSISAAGPPCTEDVSHSCTQLPTHPPLPAVAGDSQCVFLCDQAAGYAWRQLPYDLAGPRDNVEEGLEAGA